jgi:folylpolyglutamate synthase/dihydropteroate synthase
MTDIPWLPPVAPTKESLAAGMRAVLLEKTGLPLLRLEFFDRINFDDMLMLAVCSGLEHPFAIERLKKINVQRQVEMNRHKQEIQKWQEDRNAQQQKELARKAIVGELVTGMSEAALDVLATELIGKDDAEITNHAIVRGLKPDDLLGKVRELRSKADNGD